MKSFLTFDYELFFGSNSGTLERCIIEPTNHLIRISDKHSNKLVFFVDAGYLMKLKKYQHKYNNIANDFSKISRQLDNLVKSGHDIQLHIHPHWQDTIYDGNKWVFNTHRYKLDNFSEREVVEICTTYKAVLENHTSTNKVFAYRAGGWCIQPFNKISKGLKAANIWLDSTIYQGGLNHSTTKGFDFRGACDKETWRFEADPLKEDSNGSFVELPISNSNVSPSIYWQIAFNRFVKSPQHRIIGDGSSLGSGSEQIVELLTQKTNQPVFLDGIKSKSLIKSYNNFKTLGKKYFVAIGHPKTMSKYSLKKINLLMAGNPNNTFTTYNKESMSLQSI